MQQIEKAKIIKELSVLKYRVMGTLVSPKGGGVILASAPESPPQSNKKLWLQTLRTPNFSVSTKLSVSYAFSHQRRQQQFSVQYPGVVYLSLS